MPKPSTYEPLESLVPLTPRDDADIRPILLQAITDLYLQKQTHTEDEQNQYTELALGLLAGADAQTQATIAARLRDYPAAPVEILQQLAEIDPMKARVSNSFNSMSNPDGPETVNDNLVDLFFTAAPDERRLILTNLEVAIPSFGPTLRTTPDAPTRLVETSMYYDADKFIFMLERVIGISRSLAERITNDAFGEPLVVVAKAVGMETSALQRVLLALNPNMAKSPIHMLTLTQLFEEITTRVAAYMVSLWQRPNGRMQPTYESVHWNDEHRDARSLSNTATHNIGRDRRVQPSRFKFGTR